MGGREEELIKTRHCEKQTWKEIKKGLEASERCNRVLAHRKEDERKKRGGGDKGDQNLL